MCEAWSRQARMQRRLTPRVSRPRRSFMRDDHALQPRRPGSNRRAPLRETGTVLDKRSASWQCWSGRRAPNDPLPHTCITRHLRPMTQVREEPTHGRWATSRGSPLRATYSGTLLRATSVKDFASSDPFFTPARVRARRRSAPEFHVKPRLRQRPHLCRVAQTALVSGKGASDVGV